MSFMESTDRFCVILAGGGNQLWPISRKTLPKQFVTLPGVGKSMINITYDRVRGIVPEENILIDAPAKYSTLVREAFPSLPEKNLLFEPYARNTGPAVAYAMYSILRRNPDAVMTVTPSDLYIRDLDNYKATMDKVFGYVSRHDVLMTLGVKPDRPYPYYGYIQVWGGSGVVSQEGPFKVKTFTEKPPEKLAAVFFKSGEFFWNSGIMVSKASVLKEEMEKNMPLVTGLFDGWQGALGTSAETAFIERAYGGCEKVSIDNGILEKTDKAWLYPVDFGWYDVDNWDSVYRLYPWKDLDGNLANPENTVLSDTSGSIVISKDKNKLLVVKGLENFVVIDTPDALLVCPRDKVSEFVSPAFLHSHELSR